MVIQKSYMCVNCGAPTPNLYKEYGTSVLKLTRCPSCNQIADKYIEYDLVIIIIDLILLQKEAYRHILYNTEFRFHWKLAIIIHLIQAYYEWIIKLPEHHFVKNVSEVLDIKDFTVNDLIFYKMYALLFLQTISFIIVVYILTIIYNRLYNIKKPYRKLLLEVWKSIILSNFGVFLLLLSLIWGSQEMLESSLAFVTLFTTLSQLFAYGVINNCSKGWSILVILISHSVSVSLNYFLNNFINSYFNINDKPRVIRYFTDNINFR